MARKQRKKQAKDNDMKKPVTSLSFVVEDDPDIIREANKIVELRRAKSVRPVVREAILEALRQERIRLESLNQAS